MSETVTSNEQMAALFAASRAVHVTFVVPIAKTLPDAGAQTIDGIGSQASLAVTEKVTVAPLGLVHSRVRLPEHWTDGAVVSPTVTVNEQAPTFEEASVAVQVTEVWPIGNRLPEEGTQPTVGFGSQASVAVTVNETVAPFELVHSRVRSTGHCTVGPFESPTATMNEHVWELPDASVAVQWTVVVPIANVLPDGGTQDTPGTGSHASTAVGENVTGAPAALVHSRVKSFGHEIVGAVVSTTVTVKEQLDEFDDPSVAEQFTVVVPNEKTLPDDGAQTISGFGSQASFAVTV